MNFNESVKQLLKNAIHQLNRVEAATSVTNIHLLSTSCPLSKKILHIRGLQFNCEPLVFSGHRILNVYFFQVFRILLLS